MTDITVCTNKLCPKANECYRALAPYGTYQSVQFFEYTLLATGILCEHYIPIERSINATTRT